MVICLTIYLHLESLRLFSLGVALGVAVLTTAHSLWLACVAALLVGLGIGAEVDIIGYLTTRYFGLRSFGEIFGWIWAVFSVSGGLGAYLMGVGFDETGSYKVPARRVLLCGAPIYATDDSFGTVPLSSTNVGFRY